MLSEAQREVQRQRFYRAAANAKLVLKRGDRLRVSKCPGTLRWISFECWSGNWIVSKSGIDDYAPSCIDRVNGEPVDFGSEAWSPPQETPAASGS